MSDSELQALIDLLDDEQVYSDVRQRLLEYGNNAIPYLENVVEERDEDRIGQATLILREIHQQEFESKWINTLQRYQGRELDLEEMTWLIARIGYPAVDVDFYTGKIDELAKHTEQRIQPTDSEIDKVRRLVGVVSNTFGYTGNTADYYEVDNIFLNRLLDRKVGLPISLSVLYLLVARRVDIPLAGVGIPGHFMLKFTGGAGETSEPYVDPFYAGRMLGRAAVQRFCIRTGAGFREYYLEPVTDTDIVERMLRIMVMRFTRAEKNSQLRRMHTLLRLYSEHYKKPEDE
ncbi:MAG: hypothetical protein K9N46_09670 [Candidatus Marinimicrobia bacterium]|nr:hypothetical protein [Candidatus Neomarinimicrobiota bacterium]MCF7828413.1 hypothetical protein [Candidatus Neomarinimicrobiota bacterium]MCF7880993.1 hypothetical protein [Candidatus Neomarinimicrobiota bacterium]